MALQIHRIAGSGEARNRAFYHVYARTKCNGNGHGDTLQHRTVSKPLWRTCKSLAVEVLAVAVECIRAIASEYDRINGSGKRCGEMLQHHTEHIVLCQTRSIRSAALGVQRATTVDDGCICAISSEYDRTNGSGKRCGGTLQHHTAHTGSWPTRSTRTAALGVERATSCGCDGYTTANSFANL